MGFFGWSKASVLKMGDEFAYDIVKTAGKEILTALVGKAKGEVAGALGLKMEDTGDSKRGVADNNLFDAVIRKLRETVSGKVLAKNLRDFVSRLQGDKKEGREDYAASFVLFIAKKVDQFSVNKKPRQQNSGKNKKKQDGESQEDYSYRDITPGVDQAISFIEELFDYSGYERRVKFLSDAGAFSLVKKPSALKPIVDGAKELGKEGFEKSMELASDAKEKVSEHLRVNAADRKRSSEAALERAKAARNEAMERFRAGRR